MEGVRSSPFSPLSRSSLVASLSGIEPVAAVVAEFVANTGGIEACLNAYRELPSSGTAKPGAGRPSAYGQAISRIADIARIKAPKGLAIAASDDGYFVMVGMKDADGTLHFLQQPINDQKIIKSAVSSLGKKNTDSDEAKAEPMPE